MKHAITAKTATLAAALVLAGGTVVGAVSAPDDDHDADEPDVHATVDEVEVPDATADDDQGEDEGADEQSDAEALDTEDTGQPDNHGAAVSAVAQDDSTEGREHGEAVSAVAQSNVGEGQGDDDQGEDLDDQGEDHDEHGPEADEVEDDEGPERD